jgi:hypothetical protein
VAVIIPVAAAVRLTPPTVAALMMTAGSIGLFTGPFTPSTVTILKLGGLSYPDYLLYVGLPMSAVTLLAGWVMAGRIQKMTEGSCGMRSTCLKKRRSKPVPPFQGAKSSARWRLRQRLS